MSGPDAAIRVLASLRQVQQFKRVDVAFFALLLYDWLLSLQDERKIVWTRPFTFPKLFFVLARYLAITTQTTQLIFGFWVHSTDRECTSMVGAIIIMTIGIFIFTESLMLLRTIAFYRGNAKVYFLVFFMYIVSCLAGIISLVFWGRDLTAYLDEFELSGTVCQVSPKADQMIILGSFSVLLGWEIIITGLVFWRSWVESYLCCPHCRGNREGPHFTLWHFLYKHGFLFYVLTLVSTMVNLILLVRGEAIIINALFLSAERTIHALLATRLILFTRLQSQSQTHPSQIDSRSSTPLDREELELEEHEPGDKGDYSDSEHRTLHGEIEELPRANRVRAISIPSLSREQSPKRPMINVLPPSPTTPGHDRQ